MAIVYTFTVNVYIEYCLRQGNNPVLVNVLLARYPGYTKKITKKRLIIGQGRRPTKQINVISGMPKSADKPTIL